MGSLPLLNRLLFLHRLLLQHGALFALTASPSLTPTPSANNLGSPKPNGSGASHLLVLFVATSLVLCPLPTQSSSESLVAWGAPLLMYVSRTALVGLLHSLPMFRVQRWFALPTKSLVWSARLTHIAKPSTLPHLK